MSESLTSLQGKQQQGSSANITNDHKIDKNNDRRSDRGKRDSSKDRHRHRRRSSSGSDRRRRRDDSRDRRHGKKDYKRREERRRHRRKSHSSSDSSSSSRSSSRSSSENRRSSRHHRRSSRDHHRRRGGPPQGNADVHPYFQKKKQESLASQSIASLDHIEQPQRFWDGFQWITRTAEQIQMAHRQVSDINQNAVETATRAVTGEDAVQKEKRLAASKTVIIENIALDLGLTAREIQKYLLEQIEKISGEKGIVEIADIDMNNGPSSIAVELADKSMVETLKKLDGRIRCLGEDLHIRKLNEETVQTNIQSAAITLVALQNLTGAASELNTKSGSLRTFMPSSVIKVSNVFDREEEMTPEQFEELKEDMEDEFLKIPHLKRIRIVRNREERLGAEVGSVFVEFRDKKSAEIALKRIKGRIYDGREI